MESPSILYHPIKHLHATVESFTLVVNAGLGTLDASLVLDHDFIQLDSGVLVSRCLSSLVGFLKWIDRAVDVWQRLMGHWTKHDDIRRGSLKILCIWS